MRLSYRGVNYDNAPSTLEVTESEIASRFRGENPEFRYLRHIPQPLQTQDRRYRGTAYCTAQSANTTAVRTLTSRNQRAALEEMVNNHQRNIERTLAHRLQVARAKGDQTLIRILEIESEQITLTS